jgi:phosphoglycerate dehydrogenase-like enzyme
MQKIVALGVVDAELVSSVLGNGFTLISEPNEIDLAEASGALVRASFIVDEEMFNRMPNLKVLARTGVGTERVDLGAAKLRNIPVVITPGSNSNAVAEGALALALHLTKRLAQLTKLVADGRWVERDLHPLGDIEGATFGIIGYGRIGRRLANIVEVMGAKVVAFDPFADVPAEHSVANLNDLLIQSDFLSLHVPLTAETRHLINFQTLQLIKPGAILINCSRGPLIDLDHALQSLIDGRLRGLGLDVYDDEPPAHHAIFDHPNVVLTPHVMGLSAKAAAQTYVDAAQGIRDVLEGGKARFVA